ncbi:hypothetical protein E4P24_02740 [Haloferax sp. AS1]|uniref:phage NrS-1 polymerase family protein n=1 Tax=Haloferax sp. AS1 TaxID=2562277 RepID=UPI00165F2D4E|nr:hypothetical protein [Haloferax sp. AS1]MBC9985288.1 hypothetical protein [Haloferax sp. AS1]
MFSTDNFIMGIDLDDVRDPDTGELVPWAEDVIETVDSYTEISPSGTGVHILVEGQLGPDSDNKQKHDEGETEIEMYDRKRFFTMTFDHLEDTSKSVEMRPDEVSEVYTKYVEEEEDEEPQTATAEPSTNLSLEDDEVIEKAKNASNGREFERLWSGDLSGHDGDHSRADMALLSHLAFWTQKDTSQMERLFEKSGLGKRPKWQAREDYRSRSINKAISGCMDVYDPETTEADTNSEYPEAGDIVKQNGVYKQRKIEFQNDEKTVVFDKISNFVFHTQSIIRSPIDNSIQYEVEARTPSGKSVTFVLEGSIFANPSKFTEFVNKYGAYKWEGSKNQLQHIHEIVAEQDAPEKELTNKIGLQDGQLVTPNGVFTADGSDGNFVLSHTGKGSSLANLWQLDDLDGIDEDEVKDILETLPRTRNFERFLPVLGFVYSTGLSPYIRDREGEYPGLSITADSGAGKSTTMEQVFKCMGISGDPIDPQTKPARRNDMVSTCSIPLWFDEFKVSERSPDDLNDFNTKFRTSTKGGVIPVSNIDRTQQMLKLNAPTIVSSEEHFANPAEARRLIGVQFKSDVPDQEKFVQALQDLELNDLQNHAKAYYKLTLNTSKEFEQKQWKDIKRYVVQWLRDNGFEQIRGARRNSITTVMYGLNVYSRLCEEYDAEKPYTDDDVYEALTYTANQVSPENSQTHAEQFLQLVSQAAHKMELEYGVDYSIIKQGTDDEELHIKLETVFGEVNKMVKQSGTEKSFDILNSTKDYRERFAELEEQEKYVLETSKVDKNLGRCIAFDMNQIEEIPRVERNSFVA